MLRVTIKEQDKKLVVLAKIPPSSKQARESMKSMKLFEREVFVYNVLLPEYVKFQKDNRITKSQGFFNFPKIYHASYDEARDDSIIVMEDLRKSGHEMWSKFVPINYEHTKLLMTALGRLHAISFGLRVKKPELFEQFRKLHNHFSENFADNEMDQFLKSSMMQAMETLDPEDTKSRQKMTKLMENLKAATIDVASSEIAEPFSVISHGDCWTNNYLYHYKKKGMPDDIVLIDWQLTRCCSPVIDLAYFFFICTDHILRAKHFDELLGIHHHALTDLLEHLGGDAMTQFPFTALLRQIKKFGKFGVVMAAFIVPMLQTKSEDLVDFDFVMEQMKSENQEVMDEMMRKFNDKMGGSNEYTSRMRGIIHDAVRYGYL
jgi:aminoglycoside phosphotransferase (APT) family kinase protein